MDKIMVSICCTAYNHEKYIADALEGFLKQEANFHYEVLVHDDASTDRTAEIIREYERHYPDMIKPVYQTENQYSKGIKINKEILCPKSKGKYIALCEGDDYWTDPKKLQKQVDYMEAHPQCRLCFTNGKCEENGRITRRVVPWGKVNKNIHVSGDADYNMGEMILLDYAPTASLLFRKEDWSGIPPLSANSFSGDNFLRYYFTSLGYAHFIDEDTCVYRFGVPDSVSTKWKDDTQKRIRFIQRNETLLDDMNQMTRQKYSAQIQEAKLRMEFEKYTLLKDYKMLRQQKFHRLFREDGAFDYANYLVKVYCPSLHRMLHTAKKTLMTSQSGS